MPTVGFIWDTINDRYYATEPVPQPGPPPAPAFRCPFCSQGFKTPEELRHHRDVAHSGQRPFLTIAGVEPKSTDIIRRRVDPKDVDFFDVTTVSLSRDNLRFESIERSDLCGLLGSAGAERLWLHLENRFDAKAQPIRTGYDLTFRVYDDEQRLAEVDRVFVTVLGKDDVRMDDVDDFLRQSAKISVQEYSGSLADYVIGVLAKDADPSTGIRAARGDYRSQLEGALSVLQSFDRPLPRLIASLIRFSSSAFESDVLSATGCQPLDFANGQLAPLVCRYCNDVPPSNVEYLDSTRFSACPVDNGSDTVMRRADQLAALTRWSPQLESQLRAEANVVNLDPLDREKLYALWAKAAVRLGKKEGALEPLRALAGSYSFGHWAEMLLEEFES